MLSLNDSHYRTSDFWAELDALIAATEIIVDRPRGSRHPRYPDTVYPLNYGYLKATSSGDGAGIDVWIGSLAGHQITGVVATVDGHKRDLELKLLLDCTAEEARTILVFHNQGAQRALLIMRPDLSFEHGARSACSESILHNLTRRAEP